MLLQAYDALGLYHGIARTWLNPASVSSALQAVAVFRIHVVKVGLDSSVCVGQHLECSHMLGASAGN